MKFWDKFRNPSKAKDLADNLYQETLQEMEKMDKVRIIVAGKTGSGKSTLINALFREKLAETGVGLPITQNLEKITKPGVPLILYDTKGLELDGQSHHELLLGIAQLIKNNKHSEEAIDLVYYCLNSMMGRIEPFELQLIKAMAEHVPVIMVLTQSIGDSQEFHTYLDQLGLPVVGIVPILAKPYLIRGQQAVPSYGLQELVDLSLKTISTKAQGAFINAQQIDLDRKIARARSWAHKYILSAFGIGFTPIPIADSVLLIPMQISMLAHITAIFGLSLDKAQMISILAGIGGPQSATYFGKFLSSSLLKFIPGITSGAGSLITGTTASTLTLALAYSYIEVLRQVALSEITGTDLRLKKIQQLMQDNFSDQLKTFSQTTPEFLQDKLKEVLQGKRKQRK